LDNLGSLSQAWNESDNSSPELDRFKDWLLGLRERGLAVVLVHHCGHDPRHPRGATGLFAIMNTVIRLSRDGDGSQCGFTINFEHTRDSRPNPDKFAVRLQSIENKVELVVGGAAVSASELRILKALWKDTYTTQKQLAGALEISTAHVSTIVKGLSERGLVFRKKSILLLSKEGHKVVESSELASKGLVHSKALNELNVSLKGAETKQLSFNSTCVGG
jgi:DNA-binding MarR family transcriptional regulator